MTVNKKLYELIKNSFIMKDNTDIDYRTVISNYETLIENICKELDIDYEITNYVSDYLGNTDFYNITDLCYLFKRDLIVFNECVNNISVPILVLIGYYTNKIQYHGVDIPNVLKELKDYFYNEF